MPFGLPARDEFNWDTKLVDSINAVKAAADASQAALGSTVYAVNYGVTADGTTDDTAALAVAKNAAANGRLVIPKGTVVTTGLTLDSPIHLDAPDTTFKLKTGAADGVAGVTAPLKVTSSNVTIQAKVAGNRAGQSQAGFNTAGGSNGGRYVFGVQVAGSSGTPLTGLRLDLEVSGAVDSPVQIQYVRDSSVRVRATDNGGSVAFLYCSNLDIDVVTKNVDNQGWKVYPHAVDVTGSSDIRGKVVVRNHSGTGTVSGGTALSDYVSGLTCLDSTALQIDCDVEAYVGSGQAPSVGVSLLGVRDSTFTRTRIVGYNDVLLELGGVVNSTFQALDLDGKYAQSGTSATASVSRGISLYDNALRADTKGRTVEGCRNLRFVGGTIRRLRGHGIDPWVASGSTWSEIIVRSTQVGVYQKLLPIDVTDHPAPVTSAATQLRGNRFIGCDFSWNERSGVEVYDANGLTFIGCRANNNGQAKTMGAIRGGGYFSTNSVDATPAGFKTFIGSNKTGMAWLAPEADDTQSFTTVGYLDPARPSVVTVFLPERFQEGQVLTIVGAGVAGADLKAWVDDLSHDELTVSTPITTFPAVSGTGTISTIGTAVTGTGTAFLTDLQGRAMIRVGSDLRRVVKVTDDTHATIESAFPSDLSGQAWTTPRTTLTATVSQQYGYSFSSDSISPAIVRAEQSTGNAASLINDGTVVATRLVVSLTNGQISRYSNSLFTGGNVRAQADTPGNEVTIGAVGPAGERALQLGGDATVNLYRETGTDAIRTDSPMKIATKLVATVLNDDYTSGQWYLLDPDIGSGSSATLGNGNLRVSQFVVRRTMSLAAISAAISGAGSAGCTLRLGIWSDDHGYPGTLVGQVAVAADAVAAPEGALSATLAPGIYWRGAALQGAPATQPTVITASAAALGPQRVGSSAPSSANSGGLILSGQTGSFAGTFPAGATASSLVPRIAFKSA